MPLILAGPLLRRTEAQSVTVWFALRKPGRVTLTIYEGGNGSAGAALFSGDADTIKLGNNLYLVTVTAVSLLTVQLSGGCTYSYDVEFKSFDGYASSGINLATPGIYGPAGKVQELCYGSFTRPTFAMPPPLLTDLHILHGSCRKPHGGDGEEDALSYVDDILQGCYDSPITRPHQLYHTGDQIYADDVAGMLLYMLDDAGKSLFGWVEHLNRFPPDTYPAYQSGEYLPLDFTAEAVNEPLPRDPEFYREKVPSLLLRYSIEPGQRYETVRNLAGFSVESNSSGSHLIRFAEYACMYLFAWSDVCWPAMDSQPNIADYPKFKDAMPWAVERDFEGRPNGYRRQKDQEEAKARAIFESERANVLRFRASLSKVRRALANVPSYMMCDDHEVTDDWFISSDWCKRVYESPLGQRIVQNALAAFTAFQAWGNTPADFVPGGNLPGGNLLVRLSELADSRGQDQSKWQAIGACVLPTLRTTTRAEQGNVDGLSTLLLEIADEGVVDYSFCIPFGTFALLAINSRTERGLPTYNVPLLGPALLHPAALRRQVKDKVAALPASVQVTLVLCPCPVIGHTFVEKYAQTKFTRDLENAIVEKATLYNSDNILPDIPIISFPEPHKAPLPVFTTSPIPFLSSDELNDREAWGFHPECMQSFLKELSVCKRVVFFSGDVHYGFSVAVDYVRPASAATAGYPEHASFTQLTCSSMKNADNKTRTTGGLYSDLMPLTGHFAGWNYPGRHYLDLKWTLPYGWRIEVPVLERKGYFHLAEIMSPRQLLDTPQWEYDIAFALDNRENAKRFIYRESAIPTRNQPALKQRIAVGHTQIGQFKIDIANQKVYHNFWFKIPTRQLNGVSYAEQVASAPAGPITQHVLAVPPV